MSGQGEASGMAIANQLLRHYDEMEPELRLVFFRYLAEVLKPDEAAVKAAATAYRQEPSEAQLAALGDEFVELHDVGVAELAQGAKFPLEPV